MYKSRGGEDIDQTVDKTAKGPKRKIEYPHQNGGADPLFPDLHHLPKLGTTRRAPIPIREKGAGQRWNLYILTMLTHTIHLSISS